MLWQGSTATLTLNAIAQTAVTLPENYGPTFERSLAIAGIKVNMKSAFEV